MKTVPLVEGHADTRPRWTANLTTFSEVERILQGDLAYAEMMMKADGEALREKLEEYVQARGCGRWFSVTASPSGSHRE